MIVKTATRRWRLYNEQGTVIGTFDSFRQAKAREAERARYKEAEKKQKRKTIKK